MPILSPKPAKLLPCAQRRPSWRGERGRARDQLVQLERVGDDRAHVGALGGRQALQEGQQAQQLRIALVIVPALNGDAVGQLEPERLRSAVQS